MGKVKSGTATRTDAEKLKGTMDAIEDHKRWTDAVRTSMSKADLLKANEELMAKMKTGTATRKDVERATLVTSALEKDAAEVARERSKSETLDMAALLKRNEEVTRLPTSPHSRSRR